MTDDDMKLPEGKVAGSCKHFSKCSRMYGCKASDTTCDFSPSRYASKSDVMDVKPLDIPYKMRSPMHAEIVRLRTLIEKLYPHARHTLVARNELCPAVRIFDQGDCTCGLVGIHKEVRAVLESKLPEDKGCV